MKSTVLEEFRLPDHPTETLNLNGHPLTVIDINDTTQPNDTTALTPAIALATILHTWCPDALAAFLDLDAWFSFTWILSQPDTTIEIGRVGNQLTFGTLDSAGEDWTLMLTYNISLSGPDRGTWIPNPKESMQGDQDITSPDEINRLAKDLVQTWLDQKIWTTGKKIKHKFFIEYAPMDIWGDGIPMNPHWLYKSLDLDVCTTCHASGPSLQRCGKCGTATYCSAECQRGDWAVHKHVCSLGLEDRGQMLAITRKGGLIGWDVERMYAVEGSGEESKNPNFRREGVLKRERAVVESKEEEEEEEEAEG